MKERVAWVDVAKGIAMFLVVLGYNPLSDSWMRIIYSLNVPIFFLMSGFTFHAGQYDNLGQLVKRLAKSLLIPYVFLNLLAYPVFCYTQGRMPDLESAKQLFFGMLYGVGDAGSLRFNIPLWFLPCTCMIECLYYLLDKYSKKTKPIWVLVSAVLGYFSIPLFNIRLPWGLDAAFTGLVFFAVGHYFCKERADKALFKLNPFLGFVLMTVSNVGFNLLNHTAAPYVDFNAMMFGNIFLFYICAFSGCVSVVYLAKIFEKSKLLAYVGRSTLWVIGLHAVFAQLFIYKLQISMVPWKSVNSLILCVMEILCVCLIKLAWEWFEKKVRQKKQAAGSVDNKEKQQEIN